MKLADKIEVMQKALEGKKIESRYLGTLDWLGAIATPKDAAWNWALFEYRAATEPKKLWITITDRGPGSARYHLSVCEWKPPIYGDNEKSQTFEVEFTK